MDAEAAVQAWAAEHAVDWAIVRVPGIYGPGRLPRQRLEQGAPILAAQLAPWSNRIHAEDLARFLLLVLDRGQGIYNISDGQPGTITQYYLAVATVLGIAAPPQVQDLDQLGPALASYMAESRRLDITRATQELGFVPDYPDFAAALPDCIWPDLSWEQPESA
jgi:nucleoside-diphosphate-sugar epimerase